MEEEECDCDEGSPAWMATFSDLATLLLTFFVLLLSFAQMDVQEFREVLGSVREAFGVQFVTRGRFEAMSTTPVELNREPTSPLAAIQSDEAAALHQMEREIEARGLERDVEVLSTDRGIVVRIRDRVLFGTGSANLSDEAKPVLARVAELADVFTEGITIEGHTDDRPIHTSRFPSNWELSAVRAASVLRFLVSETAVDPGRVSIAGYADRHPVAENDSDAHRARNRRVEFIFERPQILQPVQRGQEADEAADDEEASTDDAGTQGADAGSLGADAGSFGSDVGSLGADASTSSPDAGSLGADASTSSADADVSSMGTLDAGTLDTHDAGERALPAPDGGE